MTVRQMIDQLSKLDPDGVLFIQYSDGYEFVHIDTIGVPFECKPVPHQVDEVDAALSKILKEGKTSKFYQIDSKGD